jgi:uncharacterized protein YjbI with pentapeptide repeats
METARKSSSRLNLRAERRVIFEESGKYLLVVAEIVRIGLRNASGTEWFQKVKRNPAFAVCIGEFQDKSDILYKEDRTEKNAKAVRRRLEEKLPVHTHEICEGLDLSGGDYAGIRVLFSSFVGCDFSASDFKGATVLSSDFRNTVLIGANMENARIMDADFGGAVLEDVSFKGAALKHLSFAGAKLTNVSFEDALLVEDLDFGQAESTGAAIPEKTIK